MLLELIQYSTRVIDEFHAAYPGARVIGVPALVAKKAGKIKFDGGELHLMSSISRRDS